MKLEVHTPGLSRDIRLALPTQMVLSGPTAHIAAGVMEKNGEFPFTDKDTLKRIFAELRRFKKSHPGFVLVEVDTKDGTHVKIGL